MTAAMAFFSIALTLNLTGVRLSSLRLADLRPSAVRSFMERRLTMASTPIIRYYDHSAPCLRSGDRRCANCAGPPRRRRAGRRRRQTCRRLQDTGAGRIETDSGAQRWRLASGPSATVGAIPAAEPTLNDSDFLETSLDVSGTARAFRRLRNGNTGKEHNMDCVNHSGVTATAFCQNCGKALCAGCVRNGAPEGRFSASPA